MAFGLSSALLNSYTASYHRLWHKTLAFERAPHHPKTRGLEIILAHLWPSHSWCPHSLEVGDLVWSLSLTSVSPTMYQEAYLLVHSCPLSSCVTPKALPCWQQRPRKCPSYNSNYFSSFSVLLRCSFTFLPGGHTAALPWQARSSWWEGGDGSIRASLHQSTFLGLWAPIPPHPPKDKHNKLYFVKFYI